MMNFAGEDSTTATLTKRSRLRRTKSNPHLVRGSLPHATALKFLRDVVDIAFPRREFHSSVDLQVRMVFVSLFF